MTTNGMSVVLENYSRLFHEVAQPSVMNYTITFISLVLLQQKRSVFYF